MTTAASEGWAPRVHPLDVALAWAGRGFPVFPVALQPKEDGTGLAKRPLTPRGHLDATTDPGAVRTMFATRPHPPAVLGVGLRPGPGGCVVLDADRHDHDGVAFYESLGCGPGAYIVDTPSGGEHHYWTKPPGARYGNEVPPDWKRLVDVRADAGWAVAPTTETPWGAWVPRGDWAEPPVLLPRVADLLRPVAESTGAGAVVVGRLREEDRALLAPHTLAVLTHLEAEHGAHGAQMRLRGDTGEPFVAVTRPGKAARDGISATIGYGEAGAVWNYSSAWEGVPADRYWQPLGPDPTAGGLIDPSRATTPTVETPPGLALGDPGDHGAAFWDESEQLRHIRDAALSRNRSPVAVLAVCLSLVAVHHGARWALPDIVGSPKPVNVFAILAGGTGAGKSNAVDIATELVPTNVHEQAMGTGEGMAQGFLDDKQRQIRVRLRIVEMEGTRLFDLQARNGATVMKTLRKMAHSESEGSGNADQAKRRFLRAMTYRLSLVLGLQPANALHMVATGEVAGGTPQRFLWVQVRKPNLPAEQRPRWDGTALPGWALTTGGDLLLGAGDDPDTDVENEHIAYPDEVVAWVLANDAIEPEGEMAEFRSHANLLRLQVAAAFGMLHGHAGRVEPGDWALAGALVEHSLRTLWSAVETVRARQAQGNAGQGVAQAEREDAARAHRVAKMRPRVLRRLGAVGPQNRKALKKWVRSDERPVLEEALDALVAEGAVVATPGRNAGSHLYALPPEGGAQ